MRDCYLNRIIHRALSVNYGDWLYTHLSGNGVKIMRVISSSKTAKDLFHACLTMRHSRDSITGRCNGAMPFDKVVFHRCFHLLKCTLLTRLCGVSVAACATIRFPYNKRPYTFKALHLLSAPGTREEYRGESKNSGSSSELRENEVVVLGFLCLGAQVGEESR